MRLPVDTKGWMVVGIGAIAVIFLAACTGVQAASEEEIRESWIASAHADETARAFSNWDYGDPPEIPESCAKCHSTSGYHDFLGVDGSESGVVNAPAPAGPDADGKAVQCDACHNEVSDETTTAVMPSGIVLDRLGSNADCMECHQGRASGLSVFDATAGLDLDQVTRNLSFANIHNNPAGPTLYGTEAIGGFEYEGRLYAGKFGHVTQFNDCTGCHDPHSLRIDPQQCRACHLGVRSTAHLRTIRTSEIDYDGDGDDREGIQGEIESMSETLLAAIRLYAAIVEGVDSIVYDGETRPYFFTESGEEYKTWTPRLYRAAYNYHYVMNNKGGYAHHAPYLMQLLYDSLESFGGRTFGMTRPK